MTRVVLFLVLGLLAGCASEPRRRRPQPRAETTSAPRKTKRRAAPPPAGWSTNAQAAVVVRLDAEGHVFVGDERVHYLIPSLDDEARRLGKGAAVRIEAPSELAWRDVAHVLAACREVGLSNLHWAIAGDHRPAMRVRQFPMRVGLRQGEATLTLEGERSRFRWRTASSQLQPEAERPQAMSLAELVVTVRQTRVRRVELYSAPLVPFEQVFDAAEALRDTGVQISLETKR